MRTSIQHFRKKKYTKIMKTKIPVANCLAQHFADISSDSDDYDQTFIIKKNYPRKKI